MEEGKMSMREVGMRPERKRDGKGPAALRAVALLLTLALALCAVILGGASASAAPPRHRVGHVKAATPLTIKFQCVGAPPNFGAAAQDHVAGLLCVHTQPDAKLSVRVVYCDGRAATNASLKGTNDANDKGDFLWYWTPKTKCIGMAHAFVTARLNGTTAHASTAFDVKAENAA